MLEKLKEFLLAPRANCMGCGSLKGAEEDWLCLKCAAALAPLVLRSAEEQQICSACGEVYTGGICRGCGKRSVTTLTAVAAYEYEDPVRGMVHAFKFRGVWRMGRLMAEKMNEALGERDFTRIVPVPLHFTRRFERGYNQSEVLAKELSRLTGKPWENTLKRVRRTRQQAKLKEEARRKNLDGAFKAVNRPEGEKILLIDDIRTTGSTVSRCAQELLRAGAESVTVLTFARAILQTKNYRKYNPDRGIKRQKPQTDPF